MKTASLLGLLLLPVVLSAQTPAPSTAPSRPGITDPSALRLEGDARSRVRFIAGAPLSQFFPPDAMSKGLTGVVVIDLLIDIDGRVKRAVAISETPAGAGFGEAAVAAAETFQFANGLLRPVVMSMQIRFGQAAESP